MIQEARVKVTTIDSSRNTANLDDSFNVVAVINAPTGPYEETVLRSVDELIDIFLVNNKVLATDDTTIHHVAKLLQTMPVRVIRATDSKVLGGVTSSGEPIYTDLDYNPFTDSVEVELPKSDQLGPIWLGLKFNTVDYLFYNGSLNDIPAPVKSTASSPNTISVSTDDKIDGFLQNIPRALFKAGITGITLVRIGTNFVFVTKDGTDITLVHPRISKFSQSDISRSSTKYTFSTAVLEDDDYLALNGVSFFNRNGEPSNFIYPGVSYPLDITTGNITASELGIHIHHALLTNESFIKPISSYVLVKVEFMYPSGPPVPGELPHSITAVDVSSNLDDSLILKTTVGLDYQYSISTLPEDKIITDEYLNLQCDGITIHFNIGNHLDATTALSIPNTSIIFNYPSSSATLGKFLLWIRDKFDSISPGNWVTTSSSKCELVFKNTELRSRQSSTSKIIATTPVTKLIRYSLSDDSINDANLKQNYFLKIGNYVYYNGNYVSTDITEILIKLSSSGYTYKEFINKLNSNLTDYFVRVPNSTGFTLLNKTGIFPDIVYKVNSTTVAAELAYKNYGQELTDKFAIINKYASTHSLYEVGLVRNISDSDIYVLTVKRKNSTKTYDISFLSDKIDGFGRNLYYNYVNELSDSIKLIELNPDAVISANIGPFRFGDEITVLSPEVADFIRSSNKVLLDNGTFYDIFFTAGFEHTALIKHLVGIGKDTYTQVFANTPRTLSDVDQIKQFRSDTQVDHYQGNFFGQYGMDSTIGDFSVEISLACAAIERMYLNKLGGREFAALFHKDNGRVGFKPKVKFDDKEKQRVPLINSQINVVKEDVPNRSFYLNDHFTAQKIDSSLSDSNNVHMTNIIAHITLQTMDGFIAQFNDESTRAQVERVLIANIEKRLYAGQQFSPHAFRVICNTNNNTLEVIMDRELVVTIQVQYTPGVKFVDAYQHIRKLSDDISQL